MIKTMKYTNMVELKNELSRSQFSHDDVNAIVKDILDDVKLRGDQALYDYNKKFDNVSLSSLQVTEKEIEDAFNRLDKELLEVIRYSHENIVRYHTKQKRNDFLDKDTDGVILGQIINPIEKVGIYVPGGTAAYPSTVLMNAVPAKVAGVEEIVMVTPPNEDGTISDVILAAAKIAGVTKIFKVGGAQAVAALSYGTETIPAVYKIVGPGNIFVAMAKKMVFGEVAIDMVAGPSEVLIISDDSSNPVHIAADLLSQAEHDKLAACIFSNNIRRISKISSS